jgi:hypothetical protein
MKLVFAHAIENSATPFQRRPSVADRQHLLPFSLTRMHRPGPLNLRYYGIPPTAVIHLITGQTMHAVKVGDTLSSYNMLYRGSSLITAKGTQFHQPHCESPRHSVIGGHSCFGILPDRSSVLQQSRLVS